ncbi:MAG: hypothetical protein IPK97_00925 [Ahniella sp.]|nr:hypothetical protein [Ahniella sp.]
MMIRLIRSVLILMLLVGVVSCAGEPDEVRIVGAIDAMELALETHQPGDFMDHVSEDFAAGRGGLDRRQLHSTLVGLMVRNENISITRTSDTVALHGDRATVVTRAIVLGGAGLFPERSEQLEIESHWQKVDGDWLCFGARWDD